MDLDEFVTKYPAMKGVLLRGPVLPRKHALKVIVKEFEKRGWCASPSGMTADVVLCWLRENGQSYRLLYHGGFRCFIVTREDEQAIEMLDFPTSQG